MNEHIAELALKAGFSSWVLSPSKETMSDTPELLEKFAELIVRKCLEVAHQEHKNALEFDWDNDDTAQTIRDSISEHFGVEE